MSMDEPTDQPSDQQGLRGKAKSLKDKAMDAAGGLKDKAGDMLPGAKDKAEDAADDAEDRMST